MISSVKTDKHPNICDLVIDRSCEYAVVLGNPEARQCIDFFTNAPNSSCIDYSCDDECEVDLSTINYIDSFGDLALRDDDLQMVEISNLKKRIQALLVKLGYSVKDVYGIKCGDTIYGYDFGFELNLGSITAFCNFNMIFKDAYNRRIFGYDLVSMKPVYSKKRLCGEFVGNVFRLEGNFIPFQVRRMFSDVPNSSIMRFSNLSIAIRNVYTYIDKDVCCVIGLEDLSVKTSFSAIDAIEIANIARSQGASIFKKIATSSRLTSGYSSIATAKVMSADAVERVGDFMIINNGHSNIIESQAEYYENRYRFLNQSYVDDETQYRLMHSASTLASSLGQLPIIERVNTNNLIDNCLSRMNEYDLNKDNHFILAENGAIIGFLPNDENVVNSAITDIGRTKIITTVFEDEFFEPNDFKNVASEFADKESVLISLRNELEHYKSMASMINYDDIINNINRIDAYVFNCYKSLSSLIASQELLSARAATYLKAVEQILKFPLKTSYGAVSFGTLAEFINIKNNADGSSSVSWSDSKGVFIPYQRSLYQRQCGKNWCILNSDPGEHFENDVLVGEAYASSLSDLQGNFLIHETKSYVKTNLQTRGDGKSEQVVIPRTVLEPRVVIKFKNLLDQTVRFLNTLLNNDLMVANKQIGECVQSVSDAVKRYSEMRKPYLEKLIEIHEYEEQIFMTNHFINLAENRFDDGFISMGNSCYIEEHDSDRHEFEIAKINSVVNLIDKKDILIDTSEYSAAFIHLSNNMHDQRKIMNDVFNKYMCSYSTNDTVQEKLANMDDYPGVTYRTIELEMYSDLFALKNYESKLIPETLNGSKTSKYEIVFFFYEDQIDEFEADLLRLLTANGEYNSDYVTRLQLINELKKKLKDAVEREEFVSLSECIDLERKDLELLAHANGETFVFTIDHSVTEHESDSTSSPKLITKLIFKELISNIDTKANKFAINIGTFSYDLTIFLRQLGIYDNIPLIKKVVDKLKYSMFGSTDISDSELVTRIRDDIGISESNVCARWLSKTNSSYKDMLMAITIACVSNPKVALSYILSMQSLNLGLYLKEKGLEPTSVACYSDRVKNLIS